MYFVWDKKVKCKINKNFHSKICQFWSSYCSVLNTYNKTTQMLTIINKQTKKKIVNSSKKINKHTQVHTYVNIHICMYIKYEYETMNFKKLSHNNTINKIYEYILKTKHT